MDSGNSGSLSLQSSSGGGDEFDSRCGDDDSSPLSALLRHPPSSSSQHLPGFGGPSPFYGVHDLAAPPQAMMSHWSSSSAATPHLPAGGAGSTSTAPHSSSGHGDVQATALAQQAPPPARASRKRTRASRRAPTTVLTTDTSNFRAMVQEFTGVPAPPFAPGATARSSRFDHLFPSRPAALSSSPYLLRPFAHKLQQQAPSTFPPPPFVATLSPANKAIAPSTAPRTTTPVAPSSASYQQLAPAPSNNVLGRMQGHGNYLSFESPGLIDGNATRYPPAAQLVFTSAAVPDQAAFSGLAHLRPRHRDHGGDELSGLVGSASGAAPPPRLERNAQQSTAAIATGAIATTATTTAPAMRAPAGVESSWICTSDHQ